MVQDHLGQGHLLAHLVVDLAKTKRISNTNNEYHAQAYRHRFITTALSI